MARPKKQPETDINSDLVLNTEDNSQEEAEVPNKFVTADEFKNSMEQMMGAIAGLANTVKDLASKPAVQMSPEEKRINDQINEAGPSFGEVNLRYDEKCKSILGDYVQRTFVTYPKGGGTLFHIEINPNKTNAPADYMDRMKSDIRTVNIEREEFRGEEGVIRWSKLVLQNLTRSKQN